MWVGGLEPPITEELLYELMLQAGPVVQLNMPRDPVTQLHQVSDARVAEFELHCANSTSLITRLPFSCAQGYAFVEFRSEQDAEYAIKIMNMIRVSGKSIRVNKVRSPRASELLFVFFLSMSHKHLHLPNILLADESRCLVSYVALMSAPGQQGEAQRRGRRQPVHRRPRPGGGRQAAARHVCRVRRRADCTCYVRPERWQIQGLWLCEFRHV